VRLIGLGVACDVPATPAAPAHMSSGIHRTGFRANDAYSAYTNMGAPIALEPAQLNQLKKVVLPEAIALSKSGRPGSLELSLPMRSNDVLL